MKNLIVSLLCLSAMTACQSDEVEEQELQEPIKLEAEVSATGNRDFSRTTTDASGSVAFAEGDCIGFFMPGKENSGKWTYTANNWVSDGTYEWIDKVNEYTFCAYYPFTQEAPRTAIPMPDLTTQKGEVGQLANYDFLVARCTTSYKDDSGTVSFTEGSAFRHAYALVSVTLKKDKEVENVVLSQLNLKADGLVTAQTYHFADQPEDDKTESVGEAKNDLSLSGLSTEIPTEGLSKSFIVNPVALSEDSKVTFSINYTRDGIQYTASTTALGNQLVAGNMYKLTVRLKKSGLEVIGNTVDDWLVNELPEANVEEMPVTE